MISFIIIGRNESWKLTKCLVSVYKTIYSNNLKDCEVIYVDSNSSDDSIKRAQAYTEIKIFMLTGEYNPAIARNIGANESSGDVLFFIDGDMEIVETALYSFYSEMSGLKYPFCSGNFRNIECIGSDKNLSRLYYKNLKNRFDYTVGGLFLINRKLWNAAGGMKTIFRKSQEIDFGLRLAKKGFFLYRLSTVLANHYTINYNSPGRKWKMLFNKDQLYGRALLYRMNLLNIYTYRRLIRNDFTLVVLASCILSVLILKDFKIILFYLLPVILRSFFKNKFKLGSLLSGILYFTLRDIQQFLGFFLFWPISPRKITYEKIY